MNQLDGIIIDESNKTNPSGQPAWRPSESAINNQAAHDYKSVLATKERLEKEILAPLQNEVSELEKRVSSLSYEIAENASKINKIIHH